MKNINLSRITSFVVASMPLTALASASEVVAKIDRFRGDLVKILLAACALYIAYGFFRMNAMNGDSGALRTGCIALAGLLCLNPILGMIFAAFR